MPEAVEWAQVGRQYNACTTSDDLAAAVVRTRWAIVAQCHTYVTTQQAVPVRNRWGCDCVHVLSGLHHCDARLLSRLRLRRSW